MGVTRVVLRVILPFAVVWGDFESGFPWQILNEGVLVGSVANESLMLLLMMETHRC